MTTIQILLSISLLGLATIYFLFLRKRVIQRIISIMLFSVGILLVIFPNLANKVAAVVGVGRGADLLLYLLTISFYTSFFLLYIKMKDMEKNQTKLIRNLAIKEAIINKQKSNTIE